MPLFEGDASVLPSDLPPSGLTVSVLGSAILLSAAGPFLALFLSSADIVFPDALILYVAFVCCRPAAWRDIGGAAFITRRRPAFIAKSTRARATRPRQPRAAPYGDRAAAACSRWRTISWRPKIP